MHLPVHHTDIDVARISARPDEYRPRLERLHHRAAGRRRLSVGQKLLLLLPPPIRRMLCDRFLSFFHSFCHSLNRITDKRGNGRRPNLHGMGKRWPSRSGWLLVVIRICGWIPVFHFLRHWGIGRFPTFVSISLFFFQFSYNQQPIWTKLGETNDADECNHNFGTFQILALAEVCTLYYRQNIFN